MNVASPPLELPQRSRMNVPLFALDLTAAEIEAVSEVLRSGWITMGPKVEAFEEAFAARIGTKHAVAVSSCTAALHLANIVLGIGPGDEVIVPSLTFAATANAVHYTGARPVFADIAGTHDWCLAPQDVARRITPRTKAVAAMHFAGFPCDMAGLRALCDTHGLSLYEDACHGIGGALDGAALGSIGRVGCFSFFSNKAMTTAEGGMLVTDEPALAERARRLRSHGQTATAIDRTRGASHYDITEVGYNYRMDDMRAAVGLAQLGKLDDMQATKRRLFQRYADRLAAAGGVTLPRHGGRGTPACYLMPILIEDADREVVRARLAAAGIQTSVHYPPVHLFAHYRSSGASLPRTEGVAARSVTLPLYPAMTEDQVDYVCDTLAEIMDDPRAG